MNASHRRYLKRFLRRSYTQTAFGQEPHPMEEGTPQRPPRRWGTSSPDSTTGHASDHAPHQFSRVQALVQLDARVLTEQRQNVETMFGQIFGGARLFVTEDEGVVFLPRNHFVVF